MVIPVIYAWKRLQTAIVVHKGFLPMTLIVLGNNGLAEWLTEVSHLRVTLQMSRKSPSNSLCLSGFICHSVYLPFPLLIACVSVYATPLDSHTCCVYYHRRLGPPHITSSSSSWHRRAGDEQEGNDIMVFLMKAWHQRSCIQSIYDGVYRMLFLWVFF